MAYPLTDTDAAVVIAEDGGITIVAPAHEADELIEPRVLDCIAISEMLANDNAELRALITSHIDSKSNGVPLQ